MAILTAGVNFEAPDQPTARWIGWACVLLGGAVLGYGAWDTAQTRLSTGWDPMRGALAGAGEPAGVGEQPDRAAKPTDAILKALKRQRDDLRAAAAAPKTQSKRQEPAKAPWEARRERPAERVSADGKVLPEAPSSDANLAYDGLIQQAREKIAYGENAQAIRLLTSASKARPAEVTPDEMLCTAYQNTGNTVQALNACKSWLSKAPNDGAKAQIKAIIGRLGGD